MKYILNPEQFFETIISESYSLFIYSSVKTCPPCRAMKKWFESDYPDIEHVYYVDVDQVNLESLTNTIFALPTLHLHHHSTVLKEIKGFNKPVILEALDFIHKKYSEIEKETPLEVLDPEIEPKETPLELLEPETKVENSSVDDILKKLHQNLDYLYESV